MTITGVLIRHNKGHDYVGSPSGGEIFFKIDTDDTKAAVDIAKEWLKLNGDQRETVAVQGHVLDESHIPVKAYDLGDNVSGGRLYGYAARSGVEGEAQIALELQDPLTEVEDALMRRMERLSLGVPSQYAAPNIKKNSKGDAVDSHPPPYSLGQVLYPSRSPVWTVPAPFHAAFMEVTLEKAGTAMSQIRLWHNTDMICTAELQAGEKRVVVKITPWTYGRGFQVKDIGIMEIKVAGSDAANLAVALRGAVIKGDSE